MEEQTSWKGQTFTLMIFGGIVVLSSIFFVLGMLVGRTQGLKLATVAAAEAAAKEPPKEEGGNVRPELTFYEAVEKNKPAGLEPVPAKPAVTPSRQDKAEPVPASPNAVTVQVAALKKFADAKKQVSALEKKGFKAFILAPAPDDNNPYFRVQVGPIPDPAQAEFVKKRLEAAGYNAIIKK